MKNKTRWLFVLTFFMMTITERIFAQSGKPKVQDRTLETSRQKIDSLDKKLIGQ
ncbi:MAG TPA: hypothetical protein VK541_11715 [Pedobacter sp.]|uniref:hypothetical protein n=1 Tax=Pedobacter sp. TaxID=1411316 RepID=UPI002C63DD46|nr:hypothetical protein [Pedobacter sp.]HMI03144.1 hypothetical protein [Pedobacter sp.]